MSKTVKFKEFVAAIEKNGLPQAQEDYFRYDEDDKHIVSACAFGQAILNLDLDIDPREIWKAVHSLDKFDPSILGLIFKWNDERGMSCAEIASTLREVYPDLLEKNLTFDA